MGILAESSEDDVKALTWVIQVSLKAWADYCVSSGETLQVDLNEQFVGDFSSAGDKVLKAEFKDPNWIDRIATLVVVVNCSTLFRMSRNGKPVRDIRERREFLSKITTAFVQAALYYYQPDKTQGHYVFEGIGNDAIRHRFFSFLERLDSIEITTIQPSNPDKRSEKEIHAMRVISRDVISVVNFLTPDIKLVPGKLVE